MSGSSAWESAWRSDLLNPQPGHAAACPGSQACFSNPQYVIAFLSRWTQKRAPSGDGGFDVKRCAGILAVVLFLGRGTVAQAPRESGWIPLFNGKDLTGWKKNGDEKWIVEQGTILCESAANKYGYLTTEKN